MLSAKLNAALIPLCLTGTALAGCSPSGQTSVVLIDRSGSVAPSDRTLYAQSLAGLSQGLGASDRVLVAAVGDADRSTFLPLFDRKVTVSDMRLEQEDEIAKAGKAIVDAIPVLLPEAPQPAARSTRILETIAAAAQAFGPDADDGDTLLILSDGVEESPSVNLARLPAGDHAIAAAIKNARKQGLLPNLAGVHIHLVGAGGDGTTIGVSGVSAFWHAYAKATGASLTQIGRLPYTPD